MHQIPRGPPAPGHHIEEEDESALAQWRLNDMLTHKCDAQAIERGLRTRLGFRTIGQCLRVGVKFGRWVVTVYMRRSLGEEQASPPATEPVGYVPAGDQTGLLRRILPPRAAPIAGARLRRRLRVQRVRLQECPSGGRRSGLSRGTALLHDHQVLACQFRVRVEFPQGAPKDRRALVDDVNPVGQLVHQADLLFRDQ